jgi:tetratricopeptide (TPR) repeat protein
MNKFGIVVAVSIALGLAPLWGAAGERPDASTLLEQGKKLYGKEDYKRASEIFEEAVKLSPDTSAYHYWLGLAYGRRAQNTSKWKLFAAMALAGKTRETIEHAVKLDNANKDALIALFEFYLQAPGMVGGGIEKAEEVAARIEKLYPATGARSWASIYEKREEFERAEEKLRLARKLEPGDVGHLLSLASFLSRRGRHKESDKLFSEAFQQAPAFPEVWFSRGKALVRSGRNSAEARELLSRYLKADLPVDATPRFEARELLEQL